MEAEEVAAEEMRYDELTPAAAPPADGADLGRLAGEPVDLLVNGRTIARGEVVAIDEELGLRITEIATTAPVALTEDA